jgi:signal recognition particle GTPase
VESILTKLDGTASKGGVALAVVLREATHSVLLVRARRN